MKQVSDKKAKRLGMKSFPARGTLAPYNKGKREEWLQEKKWLLAVTLWWQRTNCLRTDACYCALCDNFHAWAWSTADHVDTRGERPDLLHDPMNFQPAGLDCNDRKHRDMVAGGEKEVKARGDKRPESLRLAIALYRASDWELGGRRPKIRPEKDWAIKEILVAEKAWTL